MDAKLVVVGGESAEGEYALTLPAIIGRSRSADLKLGNQLVSRKHCELFEDSGQLMIRDLGSLNGTFIGDTRISGITTLAPGARITVGGVTLQAVYGDMSAAQLQDADSMDFQAAGVTGPAAASVEQTLEMSDSAIPIPEQAGANRSDGGFELDWLDEPSKPSEASQRPESLEEEVVSDQHATEELRFPDMESADFLDAPPEESEFASPDQQSKAKDDDDLTDFFASLK